MPGPPSLCCSELLGGGPGTSQGVVALVLTGDTGRPALVLCWNASLTLLWLTRGGGLRGGLADDLPGPASLSPGALPPSELTDVLGKP